ncbi:hypothetical protein Acsp01_70950 [Actinoplanes sp. NBRC 101535]|nr:hypothetical protein Acsp01_70950 [Actinoplanes sp. NBRC 101535]
MIASWDDAGTLPVRPPGTLDDHDVVVTGQGRYWECGDSDTHLMLGWFAGPETLLRYPDDREQWATVIREPGTGAREVTQEPLSEDDLRQLRDDTDEYLAEYGIPPVPPGFRWFQRVPPDGTGRDVLAAFVRAQGELPPRLDPAVAAAHIRAAVQALYGLPVTPPPPIQPSAENPRRPARRFAVETRAVELLTGPAGAIPILSTRDLDRSLAFYGRLGFRGEQLPGYAVLTQEDTELHISGTSRHSPTGCLLRVDDAAARWEQLRDEPTLGTLEDDVPGMLTFVLLDPDGNHLRFVSGPHPAGSTRP